MANVLHEVVAMSPVSDWIRSVIYTHQLKRRTRSGSWMIDHLQGSQRQDVVMVLKTRFGGFFLPAGIGRLGLDLTYSQWLTHGRWYVVFCACGFRPNLTPSTAAQDALRVMDDRPFARNAATGCRHGLGKPASAGFFMGAVKVCFRPDQALNRDVRPHAR